MTVIDIAKGYQTPLTLVLVFFGPQILRRVIAYFTGSTRRQARTSSATHPPISFRLKVFLVLHALYHISHLLVPPYDLFFTPHLSVLAPNDQLRARLIPSILSGRQADPLLDLLLVRLRELDNRLLYLRYGHTALLECLWCQTSLDYLIVTIPDILSRYVLAAITIYCLGSETLAGPGAKWRARRWTSSAIWTLVIASICDVGSRYLMGLRLWNGDWLHVS